MEETLARIAENLVGRLHGPLTFRLLLQPAIAIFLAVRAGLHDARDHQPAYFWALINNAEHRRAMLRDGWRDIGKVFVIAIILDVIYQLIVVRWVYPGETLIVAAALALLPYLLFRGAVTRLVRLVRGADAAQHTTGTHS
jgi:hypothetical protein